MSENNKFLLPFHKKEYIANFISENIYVPSGEHSVDFSVTLMNLNYENGAVYSISLFIYETEEDGTISGKKGGVSQRMPLVSILQDSHYPFPSHIDFPLNITIKALKYETNKVYAAIFTLRNKNGNEISKATTYLKGKWLLC